MFRSILLIVLMFSISGCFKGKSNDTDFSKSVKSLPSQLGSCKESFAKFESISRLEIPGGNHDQILVLQSRKDIEKIAEVIDSLSEPDSKIKELAEKFASSKPLPINVYSMKKLMSSKACPSSIYMNIKTDLANAHKKYNYKAEEIKPIVEKLIEKSQKNISTVPSLLSLMVHSFIVGDLDFLKSVSIDNASIEKYQKFAEQAQVKRREIYVKKKTEGISDILKKVSGPVAFEKKDPVKEGESKKISAKDLKDINRLKNLNSLAADELKKLYDFSLFEYEAVKSTSELL